MGAAGLPAIIYHNLPHKPEFVNTVMSITTSFHALDKQVSIAVTIVPYVRDKI